jgi:hypothetical protein
MVRRSRRNRTNRRGKSLRRSYRKGGVRKTRKHMSRRHRQRGGTQAVCGPSLPQAGAACNANSGSNYAITMVGDAYTQMKKSLASMFS